MTLRKHFTCMALGTLIATSPLTLSANGMPEGLARELAIFEEILRTSLRTADTGRLRPGGVEAAYLANQGALLRMRVSGHGTHWHMDIPDFDHEIDFSGLHELEDVPGVSRDFLDSIPDIVEDAMTSVRIGLADLSEERREALEAEQEALEELREVEDDLRDAAHDLRDDRRDLQRDLRELEREDRGDSSDAQRLRERITALEEREAAKIVELEQHRTLLREQRSALRERAQQARAQARQDLGTQWAAFDKAMLETLCSYGGTLRSLPKGEHLNLVVDGAVLDDGQRGERIYVFRKQDLDGCRDPDALRQRASIYSG